MALHEPKWHQMTQTAPSTLTEHKEACFSQYGPLWSNELVLGQKKKLESVKKKNWIVPFTTQIKKKYCTAMCYQDFNSKILRLSFSLTSFSLSTSSAIPPRLSHRQLPPLYVQTELKCPWPLRPSLWCGLVWIWQHFEWLCYSVPLFFRLVCWYAVMTKDWWLKKNFFSSRPATKTTRWTSSAQRTPSPQLTLDT